MSDDRQARLDRAWEDPRVWAELHFAHGTAKRLEARPTEDVDGNPLGVEAPLVRVVIADADQVLAALAAVDARREAGRG